EKTLHDGKHAVRVVAFTPDSQRVIAACDDSSLRIWKTDGTLLRRLATGAAYISSLACSPDGNQLAAATYRRESGKLIGDTIVLYDNATGERLLEQQFDDGGATSVAFSADGKRLAAGGAVVRLLDNATGRVERTLNDGIGACSHV